MKEQVIIQYFDLIGTRIEYADKNTLYDIWVTDYLEYNKYDLRRSKPIRFSKLMGDTVKKASPSDMVRVLLNIERE